MDRYRVRIASHTKPNKRRKCTRPTTHPHNVLYTRLRYTVTRAIVSYTVPRGAKSGLVQDKKVYNNGGLSVTSEWVIFKPQRAAVRPVPGLACRPQQQEGGDHSAVYRHGRQLQGGNTLLPAR